MNIVISVIISISDHAKSSDHCHFEKQRHLHNVDINAMLLDTEMIVVAIAFLFIRIAQ